MAETKKESSTAGGSVVGFQVPMGIKKRKSKVDEVLSLNPDLNEGMALFYLSSLSEDTAVVIEGALDEGDYNRVANMMRAHAIRELIRKRVREIVRKKPGGGGYMLYSPNFGKKRPPKAVGDFPTKLGAKRAELARFPPKDPEKLKRMRKEIERLRKDPKAAQRKELQAKGIKPAKKKESIEGLVDLVLSEALFHEEDAGSDWDMRLGRLSRQAVSGDNKLRSHQKSIEKKTEAVLNTAFKSIKRAIGSKAKVKSFGGVKKSDSGKTYIAFGASLDAVDVEPIYVYVENGKPNIEISGQAKAALTKADPDKAKMLRAELATVQERVLDKEDSLTKAVDARDKYLSKTEDVIDKVVAGMSPLEVSLLKNLLVKKYRKL